MCPNVLLRLIAALACVIATWSCGQSPSSPSALTPFASNGSLREDAPAPDPSAPMPAPEPAPVPDPAAPPTAPPRIIEIISSFGPSAFLPNPITAAAGDSVVWKNNDLVQHHIMLNDGTVIGNVAPGQTSMPIPVATAEPAGFHCTLHPSMTGSINGMMPADPMPPGSGEPPPYYDYRK